MKGWLAMALVLAGCAGGPGRRPEAARVAPPMPPVPPNASKRSDSVPGRAAVAAAPAGPVPLYLYITNSVTWACNVIEYRTTLEEAWRPLAQFTNLNVTTAKVPLETTEGQRFYRVGLVVY